MNSFRGLKSSHRLSRQVHFNKSLRLPPKLSNDKLKTKEKPSLKLAESMNIGLMNVL